MKSDLYNEIRDRLLEFPHYRERRNRHDFILGLLNPRLPIHRNELKDFINDYNTVVRYIQMIQKDHEELRGKDYDDGRTLKEKTVLNLGYSVGYHEAHKQSKLL